MTDCGGLLNRRGPGRKCCCHTDALHAGYHVYSSHGLSRRSRSFHTSFLFVPNYRICELVSSHGRSRMVTAFLSRDLSFGPTDQREVICELSNFSSHGESRRVSGFMSRIIEFLFTRRVTESLGILSRDLSFGPTDQREVIIELSNLFSHGESRRFSLSRDMFLVTNLRIIEFLSSRGMSRMVVEVMRVEL